MEQDVKENEVLLLRFKYHSFFDLNPKVRPTDKSVHQQLYLPKSTGPFVEDMLCQMALYHPI